MANFTMEELALYRQAHELWQKKMYSEAEAVLSPLVGLDGNIRNPKVKLLLAYIKRDTGAVCSELALLDSLLADNCGGDVSLVPTAYSMRGMAYHILGRAREAFDDFMRSSELEPEFEQKLAEYSNAIFAASAIPEVKSKWWQELFSGYRAILDSAVKPYEDCEYSHNRLRIGYLSADIRKHPVSGLLWPLVAYGDRSRFEIYCYAGNRYEDDITRQFKKKTDVWRSVAGKGFADIAALIRQDEIDILVELGGHTQHTLLPVLAWRPARVQVSAIGWIGSTGLFSTDFVLADEYCASGSAHPAYTERLLSIKNTHFCFHLFGDMPAVSEAPYVKNGFVTFGCFNNFSKVTDEMIAVWGRIMAGVPGSRLILKHKIFDHEEGRRYTIDRLNRLGVPADRVELRGFDSTYLQQYGDVDIALDTFPYVGGMTTFEALYMGVPVISMYGDSRGQRFGYSMLMNAGLEDLTAETADEYTEKAILLGNNPEVAAELRRELRGMVEHSPLMDEKGYARIVEDAFEDIL